MARIVRTAAVFIVTGLSSILAQTASSPSQQGNPMTKFRPTPSKTSLRPARCAPRSTRATACWRRRGRTARRWASPSISPANWRSGSACRSSSCIFDAAGKAFEALKTGSLDIGFLAIEPVRAAEVDFTAPYVLIEGTYMVPKDSALQTIDDVDRAGVRIGVNKGSAYDLYL